MYNQDAVTFVLIFGFVILAVLVGGLTYAFGIGGFISFFVGILLMCAVSVVLARGMY